MKSNTIILGVVGLGGAALIAASALSFTDADAPTKNTNANVGTSGISRTVFKQDRLEAEAEVLNTTTAQIQAAQKDKTMTQLITSAGLTKQSFHQKVKAQLSTELENQGYTQSQITIAFQHRTIVSLRHHLKKA